MRVESIKAPSAAGGTRGEKGVRLATRKFWLKPLIAGGTMSDMFLPPALKPASRTFRDNSEHLVTSGLIRVRSDIPQGYRRGTNAVPEPSSSRRLEISSQKTSWNALELLVQLAYGAARVSADVYMRI